MRVATIAFNLHGHEGGTGSTQTSPVFKIRCDVITFLILINASYLSIIRVMGKLL
ncbi:MAG: hypothetical protein AB7K37_16130 [Cyclobacteriaceae bacterium]